MFAFFLTCLKVTPINMNTLNYLKRSISIICAVVMSSTISLAQSENSLAFDGTNDVVSVTSASAYIASSSNMSISCWIYPTNPAPNYPNFDGIVGFRNESSADFYLLHLSANTLEARFRNSSGTAYSATVPGITLNTWQHVVMTYNGSTLKVYLNGSQVTSVSASGTISSTSETFFLGNLTYQTTNFQFGGKLDEVGLWSKTLTATEVSCMHDNGHDDADPALKLFYKCDQGIPNGNNSSITNLTDSKGNANGTLTGFSLSGSSSNFTNGISILGQLSGNICKGDSFSFAGNFYHEAGTYFSTISVPGGCDSIVQLILTLDSVDASAKWVNSDELHANENGATYQWIDCDTKLPIQGQTRQNFRPTQGGNYAVVVSKNGCTDTSACFSTDIGVEEHALSTVSIYPNPSRGEFCFIQENAPQSGILTIYNNAGLKITEVFIEKKPKTTLNLALPEGVYTALFSSDDLAQIAFKLLIEH